MGAIDRVKIQLGLCPSPGQQKAIWYRTPSKGIRYTKIDEDRIKISIPLIEVGRQVSDQIIRIALCPEDQQCGCQYETDIGWEILDSCAAVLSWQWPASAGCLLKSGFLSGSKSGIMYLEQLYEDPGWPIYPVGDSRNPDCPGCGMSGDNKSAVEEDPVPGELFSLSACIDEETCISLWGEGGCHPIGAELFQTVGFMGGVIHDIFDEEARIYEVMVNGVLTGAVGCDRTQYSIGDFVALAKIDTEFPTDLYGEREAVTNINVPTVGIEEYVIVPYQFAGTA